jgi:hypothetical protein
MKSIALRVSACSEVTAQVALPAPTPPRVPAARNSLFSRYASLGAEDGWYWYCIFRFGPDREIIEEWVFIPPNTRP